MNCQDMEKFIHVYLDREFAEEDRADFERHLADCAACRRLASFEERFKQRLRTGLARPHLRLDEREALRLKIRTTLESAPPAPASHPASRWALRILPAAAAAGLLLALMLRPGDRASLPELPGLSGPSAAATGQALESRDPSAVRRFYRGKVDFPVVPPRFTDQRAALVGARHEPGVAPRAAHLLYRHGDRPFSVVMFRPDPSRFQGAPRRRIAGQPVYFASQGGRPTATFAHRGVGYTITGDLSPAALDRLVRDVLEPLPFPSGDAPVDAVPVGASGRP